VEKDYKGLLASKTVWGAAIAVIASVASLFGYSLTDGDQQAIIEIVSTLAASLGGLLAIYGRVKASKKIG
jgi:hypothetical protein